MLGVAIGDALGWPNEPRSKNRAKNSKINDHFVEWTRSCSYPRCHDERILPGEYSDDTQMTLSVARSIIAGNWEKFLAERELPFWLQYERGGGGALLKAAKSCDKGVLLWQSNYTRDYFNAGGNGAVMRILPHVISSADTSDISRLMLDVIKDTLITHGHPRAFLGATCYAYALDYLLRKRTVLEYGELVSAVIDGQREWGAILKPELFGSWLHVANQYCGFDFAREWETVFARMLRQLEFIKVSLKKGLMLDDTNVLNQLECFSKANGAGDVAALAGIYLASRYANNPALGIKVPAFSFGADTDTIASITGGLLGMISGVHWIPTEWKLVQDYDCLIWITKLLLSNNKDGTANTGISEMKAQDDSWKSSPIGKIRLMDTKNVSNGKDGTVIITKWETMLGQTLYTKEARRLNHQPQLQTQPAADKAKASQPMIQQAPMTVSEQSPTVPRERRREFILNSDMIDTLLAKFDFNNNITVGKVLKVVRALIDGGDSNETIAKRFGVDAAMVSLIKACVK
jgi:ADP-ribosylglycohydrolase